jgi:hypothetical protein
MRILALSLAIGWSIAGVAIAADACKVPATCTEVQTCGSADKCGRCGCCGQCQKHCQVVCVMKEVKKTVWVVKCEDFCTSMPNCGKCCGKCCGTCGVCGTCTTETNCAGECGDKKCDPCAAEKNKHLVPPKCGKVHTKMTLEKKEVVCKVPSYKCVVVYSCANCDSKQGSNDQQTPPAPAKSVTPAPTPAKSTLNAPLPPAKDATLSFVK